jgi:hypothetical protein
MRNLGCVLGLLLLATAMCAGDLRSVIKREAGKCAAAWQRSDYDEMLAFLPPRVIQQSGGRAAMVRELKEQLAQAREYGIEQWDAIPGLPTPPKPIGRWLTSLIPVTVILHHAPDQGKHWYFVPLFRVTQRELDTRFPEFAGKLIIPDDPEPSLAAFR